MNSELLAEMKAKRDERLPMTLDHEQLKEVLSALESPVIYPQSFGAVGESEVVLPDEAPKEEEEETESPVDVAPSGPKQGKLPEDFPGRALLADAGINTFAQARKQRDGEGLTAVAGVGPATAQKIEEALA